MGGIDALSPLEVVRIFEERAGRTFELEYVPETALRDQRADATTDLDGGFAATMLSLAAGDPIAMEEMLQAFPIELTSVQQYADRVYAVT